jgi:hypothetical protein
MEVTPGGCESSVKSSASCSDVLCSKEACPDCSAEHEDPMPCAGYTAEVRCDEPNCVNECRYPDAAAPPEFECILQCEKQACSGGAMYANEHPVVRFGGPSVPSTSEGGPAGVSAAWRTALILVSVFAASMLLVAALALVALSRQAR